MKEKTYKELNKAETETTINVLYKEQILSIYTTKVDLQKKLYKILGKPTSESTKGKHIIGSRWDISLEEKTKIRLIMLKVNIFEL